MEPKIFSMWKEVMLWKLLPHAAGANQAFSGQDLRAPGAKAMSAFGIRAPVKKVSGKVLLGQAPFLENGAKVIPMIHPSAVNRPNSRPKSNKEIFEEGMRNIAQNL